MIGLLKLFGTLSVTSAVVLVLSAILWSAGVTTPVNLEDVIFYSATALAASVSSLVAVFISAAK